MTAPGRSGLFQPGGDTWVAIPAGIERLPRSVMMAAHEVIAAIIRRSGRMEPIMRARSDRQRDRMVTALVSGDRPIEVDLADGELAGGTRRSRSFVQKGLRTLEEARYCERIQRRGRRWIRLRLPDGADGGVP